MKFMTLISEDEQAALGSKSRSKYFAIGSSAPLPEATARADPNQRPIRFPFLCEAEHAQHY
jgi:hypothetical protein